MSANDNYFLLPTILTNSSSTISNTIAYSGDWDFKHTRLDQPVEGTLKEETPEAWLRRRVEEMCWRPA